MYSGSLMRYGLKEQVIEKIQRVFSSFHKVEEAILYGSRANGNFRKGSDIDLVLKGKGLNLTLINEISRSLNDLLLPYTIDLSIYSSISDPELLDHIRSVGVSFYHRKKRGRREIV